MSKAQLDEAIANEKQDVAQEVKEHEDTCDSPDLKDIVGGWKISYDTSITVSE